MIRITVSVSLAALAEEGNLFIFHPAKSFSEFGGLDSMPTYNVYFKMTNLHILSQIFIH